MAAGLTALGLVVIIIVFCFFLTCPGKELENCTHQGTTNDDENKQALSTLSLLQVKEER